MEEEHPNPHLRVSSSLKSRPSPPTPAHGGEKNENTKKCKLNWHSKCLQAAGVEVKFPVKGCWGGSGDEDLVLSITVEIADQVYKAVLHTGVTLSIAARRFRKQIMIRKTETVAIRVGDGRTIHSLRGSM